MIQFKIRGKQGFEMSFSWMFALIVGAFILFLAIYFASTLFEIGDTTYDAEIAKQIGILLNPLETGFQTGQTSSFSHQLNLRIENDCESSNNFGRQLIHVSQETTRGWTDTDIEVSFLNKYIFSKTQVEGKKFYLFSKQFNFPFKISDVVFLTSDEDKYCFLDPPEDVENEILSLGQENLLLNCTGEKETKVCFGNERNCDIQIDYELGRIEKEGEIYYFEGTALMFAGIFSEKSVYECQVKRLIKRANILADIYMQKANFISQRGCETSLNSELLIFSSSASSYQDSKQLQSLNNLAEEIENKNYGVCRLW